MATIAVVLDHELLLGLDYIGIGQRIPIQKEVNVMIGRRSLIAGSRNRRKRPATFLLLLLFVVCFGIFTRLGVISGGGHVRLLPSLALMRCQLFVSAARSVGACHVVDIASRLTRVFLFMRS